MSEKSTSFFSKIPFWAWIAGCLALLVICAGLVTGGGLLLLMINRSVEEPANTQVAVEVVPFEVDALETPANKSEPVDPPTAPPTVPPQDQSTDTPPSATATAAPAESSPELPGEADPFAAERAQIEANVAELRQLEPKEAVVPTLLTVSELRQRLEEDFAEDYGPDEARQDAIFLSAFDFIEPDFDLYNFTLDLLTEQIAGFYDPETDEFVVISNDGEFDPLEQWFHAHEFVHALQDQYYDLGRLDDESLDSEALFALQALAEGDATLVQSYYLFEGYFDESAIFDLLGESLSVDTTVLDSAPPILARELEFPYLSGLNFVEALYQEGGFAAVDAAWQSPPLSTEHILHPERYLSGDAPQLVAVAPLTDTLGTGWQLTDEDVLGEFYLRQYLGQQVDESQVDLAASGWGGDRYAVYWNEAEKSVVMALRLVWDDPADAGEFATAYAGYGAGLTGSDPLNQPDGGLCWSGDDVICFYDLGDGSLVVRAPDLATAAKVASVQP